MIANERHYRITRSWLERFQQTRNGVGEDGAALQPRAQQALRDQYDSQIEELRAQLSEYEATRYAGVRFERLQAVAGALGVTIREQVVLPVTGATDAVSGPGAKATDGISLDARSARLTGTLRNRYVAAVIAKSPK